VFSSADTMSMKRPKRSLGCRLASAPLRPCQARGGCKKWPDYRAVEQFRPTLRWRKRDSNPRSPRDSNDRLPLELSGAPSFRKRPSVRIPPAVRHSPGNGRRHRPNLRRGHQGGRCRGPWAEPDGGMVPGQRQCSGIAVTLLVLWRFGLTRPQMQLFTSVALGAALVVTALLLVFRSRIVAWFARTPARNPRFSTCSGLVCVRHGLSAGANRMQTPGPSGEVSCFPRR